MSTTYFRGLSRSQYEAFYRLLEGGVIRRDTALALANLGVVRFQTTAGGFPMPAPGVMEEHAAWRAENYTADGKRINHVAKRPRAQKGERR